MYLHLTWLIGCMLYRLGNTDESSVDRLVQSLALDSNHVIVINIGYVVLNCSSLHGVMD